VEAFPAEEPQAKVFYIRCAELLSPDRKLSWTHGSKGFTNQMVSVSGTIKTIRKQKQGAFAHFTDGSCSQPIQVVLNPELAAP